MNTHYEKEDVRDALTPHEYLESKGYTLRRVGNEYRGNCYKCGGSENATKFKVTDKFFHCKGCGAGGDLFTLMTDLENRPFYESINTWGQKLGLEPSIFSQQKTIDTLKSRKERLDAETKNRSEEQHARESTAENIYRGLNAWSADGGAYVAARGIDAEMGGFKFSSAYVCIPLYDFECNVINVVGRAYKNIAPRVKGLKGCSTIGTFGNVKELVKGHRLTLAEGVFDYLTLRQLGVKNSLGAHGAHNLPNIMVMLAHFVRIHGVTIVQHNDDAGKKHCAMAVKLLLDFGVCESLITIVECRSDLNDMLVSEGSDACLEALKGG